MKELREWYKLLPAPVDVLIERYSRKLACPDKTETLAAAIRSALPEDEIKADGGWWIEILAEANLFDAGLSTSDEFKRKAFGICCNAFSRRNSGWPAKTETETSSKTSAFDTQEGGSHYKGFAIQPTEYIHKNGIRFIEGNIIKYASRHREKNGAEDIKKIKQYCDMLLEMEYGDE